MSIFFLFRPLVPYGRKSLVSFQVSSFVVFCLYVFYFLFTFLHSILRDMQHSLSITLWWICLFSWLLKGQTTGKVYPRNISRVSYQYGVSLLYIMLEIHHSGREPSISVVLVSILYPTTLCVDRHVGLVVKASASRADDPGFETRLRRDFFRGRIIPVT